MYAFWGQDPTSMMVDAIDRQFEASAKPMHDHIANFTKFRHDLSLRILALGREVDAIKDMFREA